MHVTVEEGRQQGASLALDELRPGGRGKGAGGADFGYLAALDEHVGLAVATGARVEHAGLADQQIGGQGAGGSDEGRAHASWGSVAGRAWAAAPEGSGGAPERRHNRTATPPTPHAPPSR